MTFEKPELSLTVMAGNRTNRKGECHLLRALSMRPGAGGVSSPASPEPALLSPSSGSGSRPEMPGASIWPPPARR